MNRDIGLIDIDSKIPNLALMQISNYHKSQGDYVHFDAGADRTYISCIYTKNRNRALSASKLCSNEVILGGSGINYEWLPIEMQKVKPDYDLYPSQYSQGFTTRGCIRHCNFCIVPKKEGYIQKWQHPKEFFDDRFDTIMIMDNNWLAIPDWFKETARWLIDQNLYVIEGGLDVRLFDNENVKILSDIKFKKGIHIAWDNMRDEQSVKRGIELLKEYGWDLRHFVQCYVLVGYNTTKEEDMYRCRKLKEWGVNAFVMPYIKNEWTQKIARWANRKHLFWSIDIEDYKEGEKE